MHIGHYLRLHLDIPDPPPFTSFSALALVNSPCPRSARQLDNWAVRSCQATKGADSAQTLSNAFLSVCARRCQRSRHPGTSVETPGLNPPGGLMVAKAILTFKNEGKCSSWASRSQNLACGACNGCVTVRKRFVLFFVLGGPGPQRGRAGTH